MALLCSILPSRAAAVAAVAGWAIFAGADAPFPSASELEPGAFFDEQLVGKPAGVYEHGGRLFALARVPLEDSIVLARASAMAAASRELRKWAVVHSYEASPNFPTEPGLAAVLILHSKYFSGDDAAWIWRSSDSQSFQEDSDNEYIFAICVPKKNILDSLPVSGTDGGLPGNWSDYLCALVARRYVRDPDSRFLFDCAAPDAILARETVLVSRELAAASATNFPAEVATFLDSEARRNPFGEPFATQSSYEVVQKRLASDLPASWVADAIRTRAAAFESLRVTATNVVVARTNTVDGAETHAVPSVAVTQPDVHLAQPAVLDAERMFLTAGRFPGALDTDPVAVTLARRAFGTKGGGLPGKRDALWVLLSERPGIANAWNYLGRILREEGSVSEAIACFRCALRLKPDHEFAWANLAIAYRDFGESDLAIATALLARGLATDPWTVKETEAILSAPATSSGSEP